MWGVSCLRYWGMGEAGRRQTARKRTSSAAKFQAGVEVSLNCYHADLESFLQSPGSNSRLLHSATRTENLGMLLTWLLPLPLSECILWSYTFSLTVISLHKRVWLLSLPHKLPPHAHFLTGSKEELSNLTKVTLISILWWFDEECNQAISTKLSRLPFNILLESDNWKNWIYFLPEDEY